jgi:hypothetical protein
MGDWVSHYRTVEVAETEVEWPVFVLGTKVRVQLAHRRVREYLVSCPYWELLSSRMWRLQVVHESQARKGHFRVRGRQKLEQGQGSE